MSKRKLQHYKRNKNMKLCRSCWIEGDKEREVCYLIYNSTTIKYDYKRLCEICWSEVAAMEQEEYLTSLGAL